MRALSTTVISRVTIRGVQPKLTVMETMSREARIGEFVMIPKIVPFRPGIAVSPLTPVCCLTNETMM